MNERGIVIHCSDTYADMDIGKAEITQWHLDRGWSGCGYHYIIRRNGVVEMGRDLDNDGDVLDEIGAHAKGYNHWIGICMVGGKARTGEQPCNFTSAQWQSLSDLCVGLMGRLRINTDMIVGHNEISDKNCPTFDVRAWVEGK